MSNVENILRKKIRKIINESYAKRLNEEQELRKVIRRLLEYKYSLLEADEMKIDIVDDDFVIPTEEEEKEQKEKEDELSKLSDEEAAVSKDTSEEDDSTGINYAADALKRVKTTILDNYKKLADERDQQYYYDWLFINLLLALYGKEQIINSEDAISAIPEDFVPVIEKYNKEVDEDEQTIDDPDTKPKDHPTGITAVGRVFKEIEPQITSLYTELKTDVSQRKSFTKAIMSGIRNTLDPQRVLRVIEKELAQKIENEF